MFDFGGKGAWGCRQVTPPQEGAAEAGVFSRLLLLVHPALDGTPAGIPLSSFPLRKCSGRPKGCLFLAKKCLSPSTRELWSASEGTLWPAFSGCCCYGVGTVAVRPRGQVAKLSTMTWSSSWTPPPAWARRTLRRSSSGWPTWWTPSRWAPTTPAWGSYATVTSRRRPLSWATSGHGRQSKRLRGAWPTMVATPTQGMLCGISPVTASPRRPAAAPGTAPSSRWPSS